MKNEPFLKNTRRRDMTKLYFLIALLVFCAISILEGGNILLSNQIDSGLIGYWKLKGDCKDYSGKGNHGINHGVNLNTGEFDGIDSYIEIANSPSLNFGTGDFAISAWVNTEKDIDDVIGDVMFIPILLFNCALR